MEQVRGVALAENEKVIREYELAKLKDPKSTGYLIVTDQRLILSSEESEKTALTVNNLKVDHISGV